MTLITCIIIRYYKIPLHHAGLSTSNNIIDNVGDVGRRPLRFSDQGITLVGQLKCTSAIIEICGRLGMQAGGHKDSHEGITLVG
jgi:hypothetical protein